MQTDAQMLVVVRDQFALKSLSDDTLRLILPTYQDAVQSLVKMMASLPPGSDGIARQLWIKTQLSTIRAQFAYAELRISQVLPEAQVRAFEEGLLNAQKYMVAGGIQPEPAQQVALTGATTSGQQITATTTMPGLNVTQALPSGFVSPSITRQQIVAAAKQTGFSAITAGGSTYGLADLLPKWSNAQVQVFEQHLRTGFLLGQSTEDIVKGIGPLGPGRRGWSMTEALVRTSMAEASQSAHDAFYEANADLLPGTESGYRWWWDASNDSRLCSICAPLDGVKFKHRNKPPHKWPAHFNCRCKILPWTATQEVLENGRPPAGGSFLEATPAKRDSSGKLLSPPSGYRGKSAYKRPMRIDGKEQWVRRRDLPSGRTTAGDMLQKANDNTRRLVLGRQANAFAKLVQPGGRYEHDPQGAVRKLLGDPLPPGSTVPRPPRRRT
jgi:hypothetical protein